MQQILGLYVKSLISSLIWLRGFRRLVARCRRTGLLVQSLVFSSLILLALAQWGTLAWELGWPRAVGIAWVELIAIEGLIWLPVPIATALHTRGNGIARGLPRGKLAPAAGREGRVPLGQRDAGRARSPCRVLTRRS
jgi:hypothetical protein